MGITAYRDRYLPMLEAELRAAVEGEGLTSRFYGMMQYHMGWLDATLAPVEAPAGKRLRPMLCMLACEAVGGQVERALPAAAAIELLHNFSLVHDDIEDDSETRRHRATVWTLWGVAQGINVGDGMYSAALLRLQCLLDRGVSPDRIVESQRVFVETCLKLTEGQYLDMYFETQMDVDTDAYLWMIRRKTAALIACSTHLGALLGGADERVTAAYARFGENLGLAFQVIDDILGIWGSESETGKSAHTDILTRKKTLPVVYVLHDPELRSIYGQESLEDGDVDRVLSILQKHQAQEYAESRAQHYSELALDALQETGQTSPAHRAMRDYCLTLLKRSA